jgi:hypothetical protein
MLFLIKQSLKRKLTIEQIQIIHKEGHLGSGSMWTGREVVKAWDASHMKGQ